MCGNFLRKSYNRFALIPSADCPFLVARFTVSQVLFRQRRKNKISSAKEENTLKFLCVQQEFYKCRACKCTNGQQDQAVKIGISLKSQLCCLTAFEKDQRKPATEHLALWVLSLKLPYKSILKKL